jgi:hypothetical protein
MSGQHPSQHHKRRYLEGTARPPAGAIVHLRPYGTVPTLTDLQYPTCESCYHTQPGKSPLNHDSKS